MKRILFIFLLLVVGHATAQTATHTSSKDAWGDFRPYVGVDYMYQHIKGNEDWRFILPANLNNIAFFAGTKYKRNFGVELGYFYYLKTSQGNATLSSFNGQAASGPTTVVGRLKTKGVSAEVSAHCFLDPKFNVFGLIGLVHVNPEIEFRTDQTTDLAAALQSVRTRNRTLLRVGGGAEYMEEHWGCRLKLIMDDTQHLKLDTNAAQTVFSSMRPQAFKQSFVVTAGVFYRF